MNKVLIAVSIFVLAMMLGGCASQDQVVSTDPICLPGADNTRTMDAARDVLRAIQFQIEKFDISEGYIRTRPLSGGQFFEFWQHDNASAFAAAQSNLQSVYRTAEIEVYPDSGSTCVRCNVQVMRLSIPEQPVGSMLLLSQTSTGIRSNQSLSLSPERANQVEWLDAGNDRALEKRILTKIKNKIKQDI